MPLLYLYDLYLPLTNPSHVHIYTQVYASIYNASDDVNALLTSECCVLGAKIDRVHPRNRGLRTSILERIAGLPQDDRDRVAVHLKAMLLLAQVPQYSPTALAPPIASQIDEHSTLPQ